MNSPTITMEEETALAKLESYEQAMRANPKLMREVDRDVMRGYRVLARGGRLVDVNEAIRHGGLNIAGLPKLAIARANAVRARFDRSTVTPGYFRAAAYYWGDAQRWSRRLGDYWILPASTFDPASLSAKAVDAMTPFIPLPLRPKHALTNYFLLWEANWHPAPPIDPYLLRPITGSLMEIIAEWDVSPLELAAVRGAMRSN